MPPVTSLYTSRIDEALYLIREKQIAAVLKRIANRVYQEWISYGLRRDLTIPVEKPRAMIPLMVRELRRSDIPVFFPDDLSNLPRNEWAMDNYRKAHLAAEIPECYVAVDLRNNAPCFIQWLMGASQNEKIQAHFRERFPLLRDDEALLENGYTIRQYRGLGIMSAAVAQIAEYAAAHGARYVLTFVDHANLYSLKGCRNAGFLPYVIRQHRHYFFHSIKKRRLEALPDGFVLPHEAAPSSFVQQTY